MSTVVAKKYILNDDKTGRIEAGPKGKFQISISGKNNTSFSALKGDLFEELPQEEQPKDSLKLAVASVSDNKRRLEAERRFLQFIDDETYNLLAAVPSATERWEAFFQQSPLEHAARLLTGDDVWIRMRGDRKELRGVVRYIGPLSKKAGTHFGVEFEEAKGNTDGKDDGKQLFSCPDKYGMFIPLSQIIFGDKSGKDGGQRTNKEIVSKKDTSQRSGNQSRRSGNRSKEQSSSDSSSNVTVDSRVVAFVSKSDGKEKEVRGTVKYIGRPGKGDKVIAGIELDTDDGYIKAVYKDQELFKCTKDRALVVPLETVIEESNFDQGNSSPSQNYSSGHDRSFDYHDDESSTGSGSRKESLEYEKTQSESKFVKRESSKRRVKDSQTDWSDEYDTAQGNLYSGRSWDYGAGVKVSRNSRLPGTKSEPIKGSPLEYANNIFSNIPQTYKKTCLLISNKIGRSDQNTEGKQTSDSDYNTGSDTSNMYNGEVKTSNSLPFADNYYNYTHNFPLLNKELYDVGDIDTMRYYNYYAPAVSSDRGSSDDVREKETIQRTSESTSSKSSKPYDPTLQIDSVVEVTFNSIPHHGVIKWIGKIPSVRKFENDLIAGIELDEPIQSGASDGKFLEKRYFTCPHGRGLFVKLNACKKDSRFSSMATSSSVVSRRESSLVSGNILPSEALSENNVGKDTGIQGHHNSCYMDATLFAMFAFCSVFDTILHRKRRSNDIEAYESVQKVLKEGIVNPLRKNGFVSSGRVLELRRWLDKLGSVPGFLSEEKDPEEFLSLLLKDVLKADPFMKLGAQEGSTDSGFLYQIVVEKDEKNPLPSVQYLVEQSFANNKLRLGEIPSVLVLQLPRFGTQKIYKRIYLNPELNVTPILRRGAYFCLICGNQANVQCKECTSHFTWDHPIVHYCNDCCRMAHLHPNRKSHRDFDELQWETKRRIQGEPVMMELFAVVCIKTSHYVTFAKCGEGSDGKWVFFDSMADRFGGERGHNIPEVTECPEVKEWIKDGAPLKIAESDRTNTPERILRLLEDGSLCFYRHSEISLYR